MSWTTLPSSFSAPKGRDRSPTGVSVGEGVWVTEFQCPEGQGPKSNVSDAAERANDKCSFSAPKGRDRSPTKYMLFLTCAAHDVSVPRRAGTEVQRRGLNRCRLGRLFQCPEGQGPKSNNPLLHLPALAIRGFSAPKGRDRSPTPSRKITNGDLQGFQCPEGQGPKSNTSALRAHGYRGGVSVPRRAGTEVQRSRLRAYSVTQFVSVPRRAGTEVQRPAL